MTKANCCRILLVSLLMPALPSLLRAEALDKSNPEMGYLVASSNPSLDGTATASKLEKLKDSIRQAAEEYKQGHFDRAAQWYASALQLEPERKDLQESLSNARQMHEAQLKVNAQLPRDPREREKFLSIAFEQAEQYSKSGKYTQASQAFYKLWLTAGDYQGKTLRAYTEAKQKAKSASETAPVSVDAVPKTANRPAEGSPEVLLDEVVPPSAEVRGENSVQAVEADLNKARAAIKTGYYDDAQRILNDILARDPANHQARTELNKISVLSEESARKAAALANWRKIDDRQLAQATVQTSASLLVTSSTSMTVPQPHANLTPVLGGTAGTTATLKAVRQPGAMPVLTPTVKITPIPTVAPSTSLPAPTMTIKNATPLMTQGEITSGSASNLLPANGSMETGSTTGGPTGGAAETPSEMPTTGAATSPMVAPIESSGVDELTRLQANRLLREAELLAGEGKTQEAVRTVRQSMEVWPDNPRAQELLQQFMGASTGTSVTQTEKFTQKSVLEERGGTAAQIQSRAELGHQLDELHKRALEYYDHGDLGNARQLWNRMLELDPGCKLAHEWLENTQEKYQRQAADKQTREDIEERSEAGQKLLDSPITISTDHRIPLSEFMNALSYVTKVGLQYYIAQGADAMVFANFVNKPLREVLDTILPPAGLTWSIDEKNVITIQSHVTPRTFKLTPQKMTQVRALMDSGELQRIVWGQTEKPGPNVDITLDERQNILIVTGSEQQIKRVDSFLPTLETAQGSDLVMKIYKIKPEDGARIKALINSIIAAQPETPFNLERKIFVDGEDLIVRDTPENITKIEELLTNKKFIQDLRNEKLDIQNFSLVPKDVENIQSDQVQNFVARVVEAIQVFLYNTEGISKAREEGRRMWFDEATLQLTVVDTPDNLQRVSEYIESLPELRQKSLQKVRFLKYAVADDLSATILRILNLAGGPGTEEGGENGEEIVFKLRRGEERKFRNARFRVLRVEENDIRDRNDDSVEITVSIPGLGPQNQTIQELDTVLVDDYEVTAEDVLASAGNPGEGSARLRVRYVPRGLADQLRNADQLGLNGQLPGQQGPSTLEETGISINSFGDLNAVIIRYTNPGLYQDVEELIQQLDQPIKQVEIETKFVQVNETRAKEFSSDFNLFKPNGQNIDWDNQTVNSRFAQDIDEYRDRYSPPIENPLNPNLIKGTTVLSMIFGGAANLQYNLRLLEAEGIVNIVNGPKVMSLNNEEAEFRIETTAPNTTGQVQTTNTGGTGLGTGNTVPRTLTIVNPIGNTLNANTTSAISDIDDATPSGNANLVGAVVLRMTPSITSENSIILRELSAELIDFDGYLQEFAQINILGTRNDPINGNILPGPQASITGNPIFRRKKIITYARIRNGGTIVIGGWTGEHSEELTSGIPVLRNMPYLGKLLFSRNQRSSDRTTLLIFLTGFLVD